MSVVLKQYLIAKNIVPKPFSNRKDLGTRVPFYTCLHPVVIRNSYLTEEDP